MFTKLTVVIILQYIHIANHCCTPKTNTMLYVNSVSYRQILMIFTTIRNIEECILWWCCAGSMILVFVRGEFSDILKKS